MNGMEQSADKQAVKREGGLRGWTQADASTGTTWTHVDTPPKVATFPRPTRLRFCRLTTREIYRADARLHGLHLRLRVRVPPRQLFGSAGCGVKRNRTSVLRTLRRPLTVAEVEACGGLGGGWGKGARAPVGHVSLLSHVYLAR